GAGALAQQHARLLLRGGRVAGADEGEVVELGIRDGLLVRRAAVAVRLEAVVAVHWILLDDHELRLAGPTEVPVEAVVLHPRDDDVADVHAAAEDLDAVIRSHVHVDVIDDRVGATTRQRQAVGLVVTGEDVAGKLDAEVLHNAAVVRVVGVRTATEEGARGIGREALHLLLTTGRVDGRAAE